MSIVIKVILRTELGYNNGQTDLAKDLIRHENSVFYYEGNSTEDKEFDSRVASVKSNLCRSLKNKKLSAGFEQSILHVFERRLRDRQVSNANEKALEILNKLKEKTQISSLPPLFFNEFIERHRNAKEVVIITTRPLEFISTFEGNYDETKQIIDTTINIFIQMAYELKKYGEVKKPRLYKYNVPDIDHAKFLWNQIIKHLGNYINDNKDTDDKRIKDLFPSVYTTQDRKEKAKIPLKALQEKMKDLNAGGYIKVYQNRQPIFGMHTVFFDPGSLEPGGYMYLGMTDNHLNFHKLTPEQVSEYNSYVIKRIENENAGISYPAEDAFRAGKSNERNDNNGASIGQTPVKAEADALAL